MLAKGDVIKWRYGSSQASDEALKAGHADPNVGVVTSTEEWPLVKVIFNDDSVGIIPQDDLIRLARKGGAVSIYRGHPTRTKQGGFLVTKDGDPLSPAPSQKLYNHSPNGFNWGYSGSGPAQLALALLLDVTGDKDLAERHYQAFKREVIAALGKEWRMTTGSVQRWLEGRKHEETATGLAGPD